MNAQPFTDHNETTKLQGILPRRVETEVRRPSPQLLQGRESIDNFADRMLAEERKREGESK
jgi:hypothetical protein